MGQCRLPNYSCTCTCSYYWLVHICTRTYSTYGTVLIALLLVYPYMKLLLASTYNTPVFEMPHGHTQEAVGPV